MGDIIMMGRSFAFVVCVCDAISGVVGADTRFHGFSVARVKKQFVPNDTIHINQAHE